MARQRLKKGARQRQFGSTRGAIANAGHAELAGGKRRLLSLEIVAARELGADEIQTWFADPELSISSIELEMTVRSIR